MSALSVANLLSPQAKPPAQANSAEPEASTPFSSVLQQKVKDSQGDKPAAQTPQDNAATAAPPAAPAQPTQTSASGNAEQDAAAVALVNGEYAQGALQQLLPWLQAMQGQTARTDAQETADTVLSQATEEALPQAIPALGAEQKSGRQGQDLSAEADAAANERATTASTAANLAATTDARATDTLHKPAQESFDTALQGVNQRIDATLQQAASGHGAGETRSTEAHRLQAPLGTSQWQQEFTDRIHIMSRHNEGRAELVLTPPQLGRIEVTLNIDGDKASALFVSANPEVRTALEGAMDRLREALASSGIALGQAQVGAESSGQSGEGNRAFGQGHALAGDNNQEAPMAATAWTRHSNNMLDVFA